MPFAILPPGFAPYALLLLRSVVGLLFLQHGLAKLIGFPQMDNIERTFAVFGHLSSGFRIAAGLIETIGGTALILGFLTRPMAFLLCGFSAVAYFTIHAPQSLFPALNGGEHSVLFCFASLLLATAGPGRWAWDKPDAEPRR